MRKTKVELETLVNMDGKAMWDKLEELGPKLNQSRISEEVVVDGKIRRGHEPLGSVFH